MAVTAIWSIKGGVDKVIRYTVNSDKTRNCDLKEAEQYHSIGNVIEYTADALKTEKQYYVSGVNCDSEPDVARRQFIKTKQLWHKEGGIACFHAYQSFAKGEVEPHEAHAIGVELARRLWGDRFEVLVSTHLNTDAFHNHFVLNAVSFADGLRYYDQKATYAKIRAVSDDICREYGLSVIKGPRRGRSRNIWEIKAECGDRYTVRGQIRRDIDNAIEQNISWKYFSRTLESLGYVIERRGKYMRVRPDNSTKFFRLDKLGQGYTEQDIIDRLDENYKQSRLQKYIPYVPDKQNKPKGLYALYLYYQYLVGNLPKTRPNSKEAYEAIREDVKRARMYSEEAKLLGKYGINTDGELRAFTESISCEYKSLAVERQKLRNKMRHMTDSEAMTPIKAQINTLTERMGVIRKEMKYCEDIALRSGRIEAVVNTVYEPYKDFKIQEKGEKQK